MFFFKLNVQKCMPCIYVLRSVKDPNPLDLQEFGFVDPDPQKYAYPRIWILTKNLIVKIS